MATIPENTFKKWRDGEVVNALDYMKELEILRTAINSNGTDVSALKTANLGVLKGVRTGTSFPPNPLAGEVFYRTDENLFYVLNSNFVWIPLAPNSHLDNKENPHAVTAAQVNAHTKEEADEKFEIISGAGTQGAGTFVKFPDGTMICYMVNEFDGQNASFFSNGAGTSTPEAFVGNFAVNVTAYNTNNTTSELGVATTYGTPNGSDSFRWGVKFPQTIPAGAKVRVSIQLIGRWK